MLRTALNYSSSKPNYWHLVAEKGYDWTHTYIYIHSKCMYVYECQKHMQWTWDAVSRDDMLDLAQCGSASINCQEEESFLDYDNQTTSWISGCIFLWSINDQQTIIIIIIIFRLRLTQANIQYSYYTLQIHVISPHLFHMLSSSSCSKFKFISCHFHLYIHEYMYRNHAAFIRMLDIIHIHTVYTHNKITSSRIKGPEQS